MKIKKLISISILRTSDIPIKNGAVQRERAIKNPDFSSFIFAKRLYENTVIKNDGRTLPKNTAADINKFPQYFFKNPRSQKKSGGLSG